MSMKRLAVVSAVHTAQLLSNGTSGGGGGTGGAAGSTDNVGAKETGHGYGMSSGRVGRWDTDLHGNVNVLLGGAMLGSVIVVVFLVCYCCHRNMRKNRPQEYSQYWRAEPDVHSLEVFTMDSHAMQCYERSALSLTNHHHLHHHQPTADELAMLGIPMTTTTTSTTTTLQPSSLTPRPMTPGPPPAYESLVFKPCLASPSDKKPDYNGIGCILPVPVEQETNRRHSFLKEEESRNHEDEGLPSYEAALKLEAHGYV